MALSYESMSYPLLKNINNIERILGFIQTQVVQYLFIHCCMINMSEPYYPPSFDPLFGGVPGHVFFHFCLGNILFLYHFFIIYL